MGEGQPVSGPGNLPLWSYFQRLRRAIHPEEQDCRTHPLLSWLDPCSGCLSDAPRVSREGVSGRVQGHPHPWMEMLDQHRYTHLSVVPIRLDQDPFKTRLDVVDVVVVLQRAEHTRSAGKVRAQ